MIALQDIKNSLETKGKYWIACTGGSNTSNEWIHPNWREILEYVLKEEVIKLVDNWQMASWGIRVFNFGYDGATTKDMIARLPDLLLVNPDLVIGMSGGNDAAFQISVDDSVKNIQEIISQATQIGAKVIWTTGVRAGNGSHKIAQVEPYANAVVDRIHNFKSTQVVDMYHIYGQFPVEKFFTFKSEAIPVENIQEGDPDLIHPNHLGNAYLAKVFLKEIFGIEFNPEKYIETNLAGEKYPKY